MPFQKGGRLVHPVTRLLLYRIYHILILFANTTSRFSAPIFHSSLNTDLQYRDISSEISVQNNYTTWFTAFIENGMVCINGVTPKGITGAISFLKINKKYTPRVASYGFVSFPASGCDINKINCVSIDTDGNIGAWIGVATDYPVAFVIQYPLKRN